MVLLCTQSVQLLFSLEGMICNFADEKGKKGICFSLHKAKWAKFYTQYPLCFINRQSNQTGPESCWLGRLVGWLSFSDLYSSKYEIIVKLNYYLQSILNRRSILICRFPWLKNSLVKIHFFQLSFLENCVCKKTKEINKRSKEFFFKHIFQIKCSQTCLF